MQTCSIVDKQWSKTECPKSAVKLLFRVFEAAGLWDYKDKLLL